MVETLYYFIKLDGGTLDGIDVERTTTIGDVCDLIYEREHIFKNHRLSPGLLDLYAPSELSRKPVNNLRQRVSELTLGDILDIGDEVKEIFKTGLDRNLVHIVIVPRTNAIGRPIAPENKTSVIPEGTPRKTRQETQKLVDDFLRGHDTTLKKYVAGPPWSDFWKAPSSAHPETQELINSLEIPCVTDDPMLLLHDLGKGVVDDQVVKDLFTETSQFLVNTSGSGKTRILFEGLTRNWGFYFTTVTEDTRYGMGSVDMKNAIMDGIPNSHGWVRVPEMAANVEHAYETNYSIAKRRVHQVLTARVLVFEHFLKLARDTCPNRPINEFREHWLFLQLYSEVICGTDVFYDVYKILKDANEVYFMHEFNMVYDKLVPLQEEFDLGKSFHLILDEAQAATAQLAGCFRSEDGSVTRPVLKPIVKCWAAAAAFPIIVSGTGLSIDVVNETRGSSVVKLLPFRQATNTGAFDDPERQRKYIMRYMPSHVARSDSGEELLRRVWQYVRGRHRFTAAVLGELIRTSFVSPHRVLDAYVKVVSGFTPTDGQCFSKKEVAVRIPNITPLSFTKFTKDKRMIHVFSDLIYTWLLTQRYLRLAPKDEDLVELGFARFVNRSPEATVDEPLVLLAATHALSNAPGFILQDPVVRPVASIDNQGSPLERLVAHYLVSAFDGKRELHEILDFRGNVPQWARQRAKVVSVRRSFSGWLDISTFYLPDYLGGMTNIGFETDKLEETGNWFENPTSLLCFPDKKMGPDIVLFIRLESDEVLAVVVQCKWRNWRNAKSLATDVVIADAESLDPSEFFGSSTSRTPSGESALESVLDMFQDLKALKELKGPETDAWFKHEVPMLKVIASFPAVARQHIPADCTTLNMEPYVNLLEETGLLKTVAEKFTGGKRMASRDDGSAPNKKQRTGL